MSTINRSMVALCLAVLGTGCEPSMPPSANSETFTPRQTFSPETPPAQSARKGPTEEEAINNRQRAFLEAYRRGSGSKEAVQTFSPEYPPAQPVRRGPTEEEAANNRERPFRRGVAALEGYRRGNGSKEAVLKEIAELESQTGMFQTVQLYDYANGSREWHTSLAFGLAEAALKKGELDTADRVYRRLIEFYVGSAYSGIRDRARLGIDDVREAKRTAAEKKAPVTDSQHAQ